MVVGWKCINQFFYFIFYKKGTTVNISLDKNRSSRRTSQLLIVMAACTVLTQFAWAQSFPSNYTNTGSIANTRHNLSMVGIVGISAALHDSSRNQYEEVCVYCHTPHGANQTATAPLWNRTIKVTNYQTYNELGTSSLTQEVLDTPGGASLACLSCHDGQTAIDSIINMPGSGMALLSQATTQDTAFLNTWNNTDWNTPAGVIGSSLYFDTNANGRMDKAEIRTYEGRVECASCHDPHGVPGTSGVFKPTFLRVDNAAGSAVCLTCHVK